MVFVVHGIGPYADLKFRSLIDCGKEITLKICHHCIKEMNFLLVNQIHLFVTVNDFRKVSLEMMDGRREKLIGSQDNLVGRIEFLPVLWYGAVHDDMPTGVDRWV